jgi:hypothetical protein
MGDEQIGKEIEATGFKVSGSVDRRRRGHKQIDRIRGSAKGEGNHSIG